MTDQYDFILAIESQFYLLLITIGALLFIPSLIEIGSIKLANEKYRKITFVLGVTFLFLGCLIGFYPNAVDVHVSVTQLNEMNLKIPAKGTMVTIDNIPQAVTDKGTISFERIPKGNHVVEYRFSGVTRKEDFEIPWRAFTDYDLKYNFEFPSIQLEGDILNSSGNLTPLLITVTPIKQRPMSSKVSTSYNCTSDNFGHYSLSVPCENPIKIVVWEIIRGVPPEPLRCKIEKFNDEDICQGYKKIDINIANKISVEGKVMRYREGLDEKPTPVIGAKIYMGGRANTTNDSGWYLLRDVPRNEKKYYLNLVSGTWNNGTIIPPLEEELRDNINTIRNIYVP
jgi:hypothetical protein